MFLLSSGTTVVYRRASHHRRGVNFARGFHAFRKGKKAKRMPTTSDAVRINAKTIRSPSGRIDASPSPVPHATSHDSTKWATPMNAPATIEDQRSRSTSHTNTTDHTKVAVTWSTMPVKTSPTAPLAGVRWKSVALIAAKGMAALPMRWPIAISAPVVAAAATPPTITPVETGPAEVREDTPQNKRRRSKDSRPCDQGVHPCTHSLH